MWKSTTSPCSENVSLNRSSVTPLESLQQTVSVGVASAPPLWISAIFSQPLTCLHLPRLVHQVEAWAASNRLAAVGLNGTLVSVPHNVHFASCIPSLGGPSLAESRSASSGFHGTNPPVIRYWRQVGPRPIVAEHILSFLDHLVPSRFSTDGSTHSGC